MKLNNLFLFGILILIWSCGAEKQDTSSHINIPKNSIQEKDKAQEIVDQSIAKHGGDLYNNSLIKFTFRDRQYKGRKQGNSFEYERSWTDSTGQQIRDVFNNGGLYREINGKRVELDSITAGKYANSVNSVLYFALLPVHLNDRAVIKEYLGEVNIKGKPYHKIKVTFEQQGGGKDFEDEYIYWFHREEYTMDYLAYNYQTDGGGARFREAYNMRNINGILFSDYINYKPKDESILSVETFDSLFEKGELEELSRIDSENVEVIILK
ncbi:MAG: DUF6503 family protein [Saprospiraceae bacterium]|nr:DUF6503 family protein [Saprospiraceae bacterium]